MRSPNKRTVLLIAGCAALALLSFFIIKAVVSNEDAAASTSAEDFALEMVSDSSTDEIDMLHVYQQYSDKVTIDTNIPAFVPDSADLLYASYVQIDEQMLVSMLMGGENPSREENSSCVTYFLDDGSYLSFESGLVHYVNYANYFHLKLATENFFTNYDYAYYRTYNPTFGEIYLRTELPFLSRKESVANVRKLLEQLPVTLSEETEVYAIDHETMQAYQNNVLQNDPSTAMNYTLKNTLTEDDDVYLICFWTQLNDLPVTAKDYDTLAQGRYIIGSSVEVFYSTKGVIKLTIKGAYQVQDIAESATNLLTAQQALDKVAKVQNTFISDETITLVGCRLEYVGVPYNDTISDVLLTPAWNITVAHTLGTGDESMTYCETISINAVTGDEIK